MYRKNILRRFTGNNNTLRKFNFILEKNSCGFYTNVFPINIAALTPCYFDISTNRKIRETFSNVLNAAEAYG